MRTPFYFTKYTYKDRKDVKPKDPTAQLSNYIELKTSRIIETSRHDYSFQR